MDRYRTHNCGELRKSNVDERVRLAGWVNSIRDHGGVIFIDLRDHYGITQIVTDDDSLLKGIGREYVISVEGVLRQRSEDTVNSKIATGEVEVLIDSLTVLALRSRSCPLKWGIYHDS